MKKKITYLSIAMAITLVGAKILSLIYIYILSINLGKNFINYSYAYIPFSFFMEIASLGLIPGTSKAVSLLDEAKRGTFIRKTSLYSLAIGIIFFALFLFFIHFIVSRNYNRIIINNLYYSALSILIYPIYTLFRGYLQGKLRVIPVTLGVLTENIIRILLLLFMVNNYSGSRLYIAVFFGNFLSYLTGLIVLFIFIIKDFKMPKNSFNAISYLLKIAIPFGIITTFFTIFQIIDSLELPLLKINRDLITSIMYKSTRLIFFPVIVCQSIAGILTPKINTLLKEGNSKKAYALAKEVIAFSIELLIPLVFIFNYNAKDLYLFFYNENLYYILEYSAYLIFFIGFYKILISVLQGSKNFNMVIIVTIISIIAKIVMNIIFISKIGVIGSIYSSIIALTICILGSYYILSKDGIHIFKNNIFCLIRSILFLFGSIYYTVIIKLLFFNDASKIIMTLYIICIYLLLSVSYKYFIFYIEKRNLCIH